MARHVMREVFERYLEDFAEGDVIEHWPGRTITEYANEAFCLATMNHQPLHLDAEFAGQSSYGKVLVNGMLVFATAVGLSIPGMSGKIVANLGFDKVVHHGPVFIGDTIYAESEIREVRPSRSRPDVGIVKAETRVSNQRGEVVLTFERGFMAYRRSRDHP